jgi:hypothetical protein
MKKGRLLKGVVGKIPRSLKIGESQILISATFVHTTFYLVSLSFTPQRK